MNNVVVGGEAGRSDVDLLLSDFPDSRDPRSRVVFVLILIQGYCTRSCIAEAVSPEAGVYHLNQIYEHTSRKTASETALAVFRLGRKYRCSIGVQTHEVP